METNNIAIIHFAHRCACFNFVSLDELLDNVTLNLHDTLLRGVQESDLSANEDDKNNALYFMGDINVELALLPTNRPKLEYFQNHFTQAIKQDKPVVLVVSSYFNEMDFESMRDYENLFWKKLSSRIAQAFLNAQIIIPCK